MGAILHCPLSLQPVWSWIMQILPTISEYTAQESTHFCSFSWHTGSFMSHDWYWWKHPWNFHIQQIHARSWLIFHVFDAHVLYICYGNTLPPAKELDEHHVRSHSIQLMNHSWCRIAHSKATLTKQTAAINNTEFWANQKQSAYKPTVASVTPGVCPMLHHKEPRKHFYLHLHSDSSRSATLTLFLPSRCSFSWRAETHLPPAWHRVYQQAGSRFHTPTPPCSKLQGALGWGRDTPRVIQPRAQASMHLLLEDFGREACMPTSDQESHLSRAPGLAARSVDGAHAAFLDALQTLSVPQGTAPLHQGLTPLHLLY